MVLDAYAQQFKKEFRLFLELRAKELVPGGQMVVSLGGRHSNDIASKSIRPCEALYEILHVMDSEVHSFTSLA